MCEDVWFCLEATVRSHVALEILQINLASLAGKCLRRGAFASQQAFVPGAVWKCESAPEGNWIANRRRTRDSLAVQPAYVGIVR
jgi:hypothetical protein